MNKSLFSHNNIIISNHAISGIYIHVYCIQIKHREQQKNCFTISGLWFCDQHTQFSYKQLILYTSLKKCENMLCCKIKGTIHLSFTQSNLLRCSDLADIPAYNFHNPLKPCMLSGPRKRTIVRNTGITTAGSRPCILRPNSCHKVAWKKEGAIYTQTTYQAINKLVWDFTCFNLISCHAFKFIVSWKSPTTYI